MEPCQAKSERAMNAAIATRFRLLVAATTTAAAAAPTVPRYVPRYARCCLSMHSAMPRGVGVASSWQVTTRTPAVAQLRHCSSLTPVRERLWCALSLCLSLITAVLHGDQDDLIPRNRVKVSFSRSSGPVGCVMAANALSTHTGC